MLFNWKYKCNDSLKNQGLVSIKAKRIQNKIKCSQLYKDHIHESIFTQTKFKKQ